MILADSLSRLPKKRQDEMIDIQANVNFVQFSTPKLRELREATMGRHYQEMISKFGITHITSSPVHPRSHGFIENAVKTAKSLIRKSPDDISTALLLHRTTPIGTGLPSPAELLFNRQIANNLPVRIKSHTTDQHREILNQRDQHTATYYNQHTHELPQLHLNQPIFYQDVAKRSWTPGKIIGCGPEPRSFTVECILELQADNFAGIASCCAPGR